MAFASSHGSFTTSELADAIPEALLNSRSTLEWHISQLTKENKLGRIGKGRYSSHSLSAFTFSTDDTDKNLYSQLKDWYPDATFCVYKGTILSSLQHHLSYNTLTYVETERELAETIFRRIREKGQIVFHKPNKKVFYDYVDISNPGIIVKPLISGSPLKVVDNMTVPMLEKLLVDIRRDDDFDYLGGGEARRMLENAASLYTLNTTKLLRYAGRRHCREEFEKELRGLGL